ERPRGIEKRIVVELIRNASRLILEGFSLPVKPLENLAPDGQLFVEMCEKDKEFCALVTERLPNRMFTCLEIWVEDFVHEERQWKLGGFMDNNKTISCAFNHTLLDQLRTKYGI
ncbi:unnamed protein product, partial [Rotaria socialis]